MLVMFAVGCVVSRTVGCSYCFALSNCECLIRPEVTLHGGQNVKILEPANFFFSVLQDTSFFSAAFWGMFCRLLFGACSADVAV